MEVKIDNNGKVNIEVDDQRLKHSGIGGIKMWQYNNYNELYHHGVKGQKWGVRHYQKEDGSLTNAGKKRYGGASSYASMVRLSNDLGREHEESYNQYKSAIKSAKADKKAGKIDKFDYREQRIKAKDAYTKNVENSQKNAQKILSKSQGAGKMATLGTLETIAGVGLSAASGTALANGKNGVGLALSLAAGASLGMGAVNLAGSDMAYRATHVKDVTKYR